MELVATDPPYDLLLAILTDHPAGLKEYDLYQQFQERGKPLAPEGGLADSLILFRCHFLLFHWLYRLRERLRGEGEWDLEIHCLRIVLRKSGQGHANLPMEPDYLQGYYLDPSHLESTSRDEVDQMLQQFWGMYHRQDRRLEALATLGLTATAQRTEIRQRFHALALANHPDHGGSADAFQRLMTAMETLRE